MKLRRRKIVLGLMVAALTLALLAFPFGPLLPWSPIKPGYHTTSFAQSDVYFDEGATLLDDYRLLDQMMREAEEFHQLSFRKRVKVVACKNWGDCARALPWLNVKPLGGVTLATGEVIYITPKLQERNFSVAEFLRHELSHALISQHISIRNSLKLTEQAWFSEGLERVRKLKAISDESASQAKKGIATLGALFPIHHQPAKPVEPSVRAFDQPTAGLPARV